VCGCGAGGSWNLTIARWTQPFLTPSHSHDPTVTPTMTMTLTLTMTLILPLIITMTMTLPLTLTITLTLTMTLTLTPTMTLTMIMTPTVTSTLTLTMTLTQAFPDAEDLHSVHDRGYDVTATVAININIDVFHGCEFARSRARFTNSFDRELLIASGMPEYANLPSSTLVVCCLAL